MKAEKQCRGCRKIKPLNDFYVHHQMADGYLNFCKECVKSRERLYRRNNPEHVAAIDKATYEKKKRNPEFKQKVLAYSRKWRTPEIRRAHNLARRRLSKIKPNLCEFCHERIPEHAHHPNYLEPLNVLWLCARCHQRLHHSREEAHV